MPVTVQIDGVGNVQMDDSFKGLSAADQQATVDEIANQHAAAQPARQQSFGQNFNNAMAGFGKAFYDVPQSIAELGARGLDATGLTHGAYNTVKAANVSAMQKGVAESGADANSPYFKGGNIAGDVVSTLPVMGVNPLADTAMAAKLPALAQIVTGAGQGAAAAGLTSSNSDQPLGQQFALGALGGAALPTLGAAVKGAGKALPYILGDLTSGAGSAAVKQAFNAGKQGGNTSAAFLSSMRGDTPAAQVVADAKDALANMRADRNAAYRSGMTDISGDKTVLSFDGIDKAMGDASQVKTFKGQDLSKSTGAVRGEIQATIDNWKSLDPAEYHTPEGFDALKQQIGDIKDNLPYNSPQWVVANKAYSAVRKSITDQAPAYDKVMADYSKASDAVSDIQRELSLGPKGNPATALRKLQSVMRDNANTSWGQRADYANALQDAGAKNLLPQIAGQALSSPMPRGLGRLVASGELGSAAGAALMGHPLALAALAPALAAASPRFVGEGAYYAGSAARLGNNAVGKMGIAALPKLAPGAFNTGLGSALPSLLAARPAF